MFIAIERDHREFGGFVDVAGHFGSVACISAEPVFGPKYLCYVNTEFKQAIDAKC